MLFCIYIFDRLILQIAIPKNHNNKNNMLYIANSHGKGRGVYTDNRIERDTVIEECPVLEIPHEEVELLELTMLNNYYFAWGKDQKQAALALGLGSIYNHSYTPNAIYRPRESEQVIEFVAIRKILANEEITINYNGSPNDQSPLWGSDEIPWLK